MTEYIIPQKIIEKHVSADEVYYTKSLVWDDTNKKWVYALIVKYQKNRQFKD